MPKKIIDAKADSKGNITDVRFGGNATFTPVETAIRMAKRGEVVNAHAVRKPDGDYYLRSNPDERTGNNLDALAADG
jgi:hypothetical protein